MKIFAMILMLSFAGQVFAAEKKSAKGKSSAKAVAESPLFNLNGVFEIQIDEKNHMGLPWHQEFKITRGKLSSPKLAEKTLSNEEVNSLNRNSLALSKVNKLPCGAGVFTVSIFEMPQRKTRKLNGCLEDAGYKVYLKQLQDWKLF